MSRPRLPAIAGFVLLLSLLLLAPPALRAHGIGTPQQINVPSGPYLISIWTDPDPLRVDEAHVVVAVMDPETRRVMVENISVTVELTQPDSGDVVVGQGDSSISTNQLLHAVEFNDLLDAGVWDGAVLVNGPSGPGVPVRFTFDVQPSGTGPNWLLIGAAGIAAIIGVWVVAALRRPSGEASAA